MLVCACALLGLCVRSDARSEAPSLASLARGPSLDGRLAACSPVARSAQESGSQTQASAGRGERGGRLPSAPAAGAGGSSGGSGGSGGESGVVNAGFNCHAQCDGRSGACPGFCGSGGTCCRIGFDVGAPDCGDGARGCDGMHCCVAL